MADPKKILAHRLIPYARDAAELAGMALVGGGAFGFGGVPATMVVIGACLLIYSLIGRLRRPS